MSDFFIGIILVGCILAAIYALLTSEERDARKKANIAIDEIKGKLTDFNSARATHTYTNKKTKLILFDNVNKKVAFIDGLKKSCDIFSRFELTEVGIRENAFDKLVWKTAYHEEGRNLMESKIMKNFGMKDIWESSANNKVRELELYVYVDVDNSDHLKEFTFDFNKPDLIKDSPGYKIELTKVFQCYKQVSKLVRKLSDDERKFLKERMRDESLAQYSHNRLYKK